MGSTLTNTQPKDTYKSLLKTSDSTELSATAKYVSDGNGNDSPLALSTSNVGIGTSSPSAKLHIQGSIAGASPAGLFRVGNSGTGYMARMILTDETTVDGNIVLQGSPSGASAQYIGFGLGSNLDTLKLTGDSYLRMASGTGGIQFNGDTAAANALDDYEEGSFTPTLAFDGLSTGITYGIRSAKYVKIGSQVTCTGLISLSNKGTATGVASVKDLPFVIGSGLGNYASVCLADVAGISFADIITGYGIVSTSYFRLYESTKAGVQSSINDGDFTNSSEFIFTLTYFV